MLCRSWIVLASLSAALVGCSDVGDTTSVGEGEDAAGGPDSTALDSSSDTSSAETSADAGDAADVAVDAPPSTDATVDAESDADATADGESDADATVDGESDADATVDGKSDATIDASDAGPDSAIDGAVDAAKEAGRLPDGGCDPSDSQCLCDTFIQMGDAGSITPQSTCSGTELVLFEKDVTGDCLKCALLYGQCIDNSPDVGGVVGFDCEDPFTGAGAGGTTDECLAVLACDIGVDPKGTSPVVAGGAGVIVSYCGTVQPSPCGSGTAPNGACISPITAGFPSTFSAGQITAAIGQQVYASGRAGAIAACLLTNSCDQCLN
ncbi:MAG: MSCRAMM family adhesin SdrC [Polyangiaceae bacterium]|nr:MSCRAMM family adhesin SdrC [Polyangiaceae bacterium]